MSQEVMNELVNMSQEIIKLKDKNRELLGACKKALSAVTDRRIGQWDYMEGSQIYDDFNAAAEVLGAAIAKAESAQ